MKKKALRKDFYMEIRRSLGRFLSIFFIVAIGVAFFSGIRAAEPDMRYSGDAYFDNRELMDIKAVSTMGLTEEDRQAVESVDGIEKAEGGYSADVLCSDGDNKTALKIVSILPTMNKPQLEEGRMPKSEQECVADVDYLAESGFKIGDEITVSGGNDTEIGDILKTDTYKIVGTVSSPCYPAFSRGSTTIGNGTLSGYLCVLEEAFCMDVYTEIYARVEGAGELTAFTPAYESHVEKVFERVEAICEERENARYESIMSEAEEELQKAEDEVAKAERELADGKAEAEKELADARKKLEDAQAELERGKEKLSSSRAEIAESKNKVASSEKEISDGQKALDNATAEVNRNIDALNERIDELNAAKAQYNALAQVGAADPVTQAMLQAMDQQITNGEIEIEQARAQLRAVKEELSSRQEELNRGRSQIAEAEQKISDGERKVADAQREIASGEADLAKGQADYAEAEKKAKEEIADGERKIEDAKKELADARKEISKIEKPRWYVYDRDALTDYTGYGENADRMRAIGEVFPVLFFLVAALISLTTMTRMVEEQRTMIGTLKALGYDRHSIAAKYLGYAVLATVAGSIFGVLIGEKILPYIIITAYGIMYRHIHEICLPYNVKYALMASGAALFSTTVATVFSCYKELREQAAELMRPPAPKQGQRVALERVGFIWKRLSFTWKATVRNLVRYKKRFFMTVFGIGGCMALLLVGFGLKDSIFAIAKLQYEELQFFDGNVILDGDASGEEKEEVKEWFAQEKRVVSYTESLLTNITIGNGKEWREVYLNVPKEPERFAEFNVLRDRITKTVYSLDESGAILTEKMAKELGIEKGDTIVIRDEDAGDLTVTVTEICENYMRHYLYLTADVYEKLYGKPFEANSVCYKTKDRTTEEAEKIGEDVLTLEGALSVTYTTDMKQQVEDMLRSLDLVIIVLIISAGMLAFVVLYNLNNINITERKRELATLKVLGFYSGEVAAYVYRENSILTVIGSVVGMALGKVLHRFIIVTVEIESVMFGRNIEPVSFVYGFVLTVLFSLIVNAVMYFKLKQINMVESMKSVE